MKKGVFILCLAISVLFAVSSVCASDVNDMAITSDDADQVIEEVNDDAVSEIDEEILSSSQDEIIGVGDDGTFTALQDRIDAAAENSTLTLENNYVYEDGFDTNGITISKSIIIDGKGYTIDGNNKTRIFSVTNSNVVFKNIVFVNGETTGDGGAINGECTAVNCSFISNSANGGGAMYGGSAVNCSFISNSANGGGAMIYGSAVNCTFNSNSGRAMYYCSAVNCSFINNSAKYDGGAMYGGSAVNCSFISNSAEYGGAVYECSAVNCTFDSNSATRNGGAMSGGSAVNCIFNSNSATYGGAMSGGSAGNCTFYSNSASLYGGAAYHTKMSSDSKFNNNIASEGNDTYEIIWFKAVYSGKTFHELNELINNNTETDIYLDSDYTFDIIKDSDFEDGIFINRAVTIYGNGHIIDGNNFGRIFYVWRNSLNVVFKNIVFVNGKSTHGGGAIVFDARVIWVVENCTFINNSANEGGAIYFWDQGTVTNSNFVNNSASSCGGAVYLRGGEFEVTNCNFTNNYANCGGAIYAEYGLYGKISNNYFVSNIAENGGAIYGDIDDSVLNGDFIHNSANNGGAIYGNIVGSTLNGDFISNIASYGGGIYGDIINSIFNGDFIENSANAGGAICGNITDSIFNGYFTENIANMGGAICGNVSDSIFNGDFINNAAITAPLTMSDVLSAGDNDVLNFAPAMNGVGGGICGNVVGSTLNTNFVMNTANVGAVIAGNVEKSVFTGKISKNTASNGIIISGNVIKSVFSGDIADISEIYGEISGDWIDSFIKKFLNEKEREQLERLQNLTKKLEIEIEFDINIYVDDATTINPDNVSVSYHFDLMNFVTHKTDNYDISKLKDVSNPFDGPLGTLFDKMLDDFLHSILDGSPEPNINGSTAYLTLEIKTLNNLKDAIQIANAFGLSFKENYFKIIKQFTLDELSVKIAPGVYQGDKNNGLEIVTNYTLMKDGDGDVIIDAGNSGNILTLRWPTVTIDGLTFMHASNSAIICENGLIDSRINANFIDNFKSHNDNYYGGAAIYSKKDIIHSVINGTFQNNNMNYGYGGAIYIKGNVDNCIFDGNYINNSFYINSEPTLGVGGVLYCNKIINSIFAGNFIGNAAFGYSGGGAIYAEYIIGSTFSGNFVNNRVDIDGGAISAYSILDSNFSGYFKNNIASRGGAISSSQNISNSIFDGIFIDNVALHTAFLGGSVIYGETILNSIINGSFIHNSMGISADSGGGVILCYDLLDCIITGHFINNSAGTRGGVILSLRTIRDTLFNGEFRENGVTNNNNQCYGGVIFCKDIIRCDFFGEFIDNYAEYGGVIFIEGTIEDCGFYAYYKGNTAIYGNILWARVYYRDITGESLHNHDNIPDSDIYESLYPPNDDNLGSSDILSCSIPIDNLQEISSNEIYVDVTAEPGGDGSPYNPFNNLKTAIDNAIDGDMIYICPGTYTGENNTGLTINKNLNLIKLGSGVIFDAQNNGRIFTVNTNYLNIIGLTFTNATDSAIRFNNGIVNSMIYANFENNRNKSALYVTGSIINSIFSGNYINNIANDNGAAIYADNFANSVLDCNFINNIATNGGAIAGNIVSSTINGNFSNNNANDGGAIFGNVMSSVFNAEFTSNTANHYGGVIFGNVSSSNFTSNFINNNAAAGGVIYGSVSSSNFHSSFINNICTLFGGVIFGSVSSSNFIGKYINNNSACGRGGLVSEGSISKSLFKGEFIDNRYLNGGKIFHVFMHNSISDSKFIGEIFASNSTNIDEFVYCNCIINCIFNNREPIDEKDINIPPLGDNLGRNVTIKLPNDAEGTITLNIGGESYNFDVIDGVANVKVPELIKGVYPYSIIYSGDDNYATFTKTGSLTINNSTQNTDPENSTNPQNSTDTNTTDTNTTDPQNPTNNPKPITDDQITISSFNSGSGNVQLPSDAKGMITLDIAGKTYNFSVVNGVANVKVPNLANGTYPYSIIYSGDDNYAPFTKTGILTIKNNSQNPFNPTNPSNPANTNTQTVTTKKTTKTTLTLKKVAVKKSAKKLVISATLKINGKAVKGKIIKFKFNKKTYKVKTNKKGVAKITIKKTVLKKLKVGKKVAYTATYGKTTKKITVKVKK